MRYNALVTALPGVPAHRPLVRVRRAWPAVALVIALAGGAAAAIARDGHASTDSLRTAPPLHRSSASASQDLLVRTPGTRLGLGGLRLGGDVTPAAVALGAPQRSLPDDMFGPAYVWEFQGGSVLVGVWNGTAEISALEATVEPEGPGSVAFHGGLHLGEATLAEVIHAWGEPARVAEHPDDDFVVAYDACVGPAPVVIKFDQSAVAAGAGDLLALDEPVTRLLIAYADAPPGTGGCAVSSSLA